MKKRKFDHKILFSHFFVGELEAASTRFSSSEQIKAQEGPQKGYEAPQAFFHFGKIEKSEKIYDFDENDSCLMAFDVFFCDDNNFCAF